MEHPTQCPKCAYVRKPTDTAPDNKCPACGIIYFKHDPDLGAKLRASQEARRSKPAARMTAQPMTAQPDTGSPPPPAEEPALPQPHPAAIEQQSTLQKTDGGQFTRKLRKASNYPTFRLLVTALTVIGYLLAVVAGISASAVVSFFLGIGWLTLLVLLLVILGGVLTVRITMEVSLMIADAADAVIYMAKDAHDRAGRDD